ncbi:hypothetical protein USB125703_00150 [Pseudoclavibacter triregionum]|nr:hypothetical protein USB125703_00150 [Pseudoclavibacter triregionum]
MTGAIPLPQLGPATAAEAPADAARPAARGRETADSGTRLAGVLATAAGATLVTASASFIKASDAGATTATFVRCALAIPFLLLLALPELRRHGLLPKHEALISALAGLFLGLDYLMWSESIGLLGSGIATILVGAQALAFPALAWALDGARPSARYLIGLPVALAGLALAGGALGSDPAAAAPFLGSALAITAGAAYGVFLYGTRRAARSAPKHAVTPVLIATTVSAAMALAWGVPTGTLRLDLDAAQWPWLIALAICGQVLPWVLFGLGGRRLDAGASAVILLIQPIGALLIGATIAGESPAGWQWAGSLAVVLAAAWIAGAGPGPRLRPAAIPEVAS